MVPSNRVEQAEDGHLILDHMIAVALREEAAADLGDGILDARPVLAREGVLGVGC